MFDKLWALIDEEEPPKPGDRDVDLRKILAAAVLQAAVFAGVRAATDRGSRKAFSSLTGTWPGEKRPDPASDS